MTLWWTSSYLKESLQASKPVKREWYDSGIQATPISDALTQHDELWRSDLYNRHASLALPVLEEVLTVVTTHKHAGFVGYAHPTPMNVSNRRYNKYYKYINYINISCG
jgi:hypothetical protein